MHSSVCRGVTIEDEMIIRLAMAARSMPPYPGRAPTGVGVPAWMIDRSFEGMGGAATGGK